MTHDTPDLRAARARRRDLRNVHARKGLSRGPDTEDQVDEAR